jgi:phage shock protein C
MGKLVSIDYLQYNVYRDKWRQKMATKVLTRQPQQGKITGVCAGLSDYFEIDVSLIRIIFVVVALATGGFALLVYIVMAIILPTSPKDKR